MDLAIPTTRTVTARAIRCHLPDRYDGEDLEGWPAPALYPLPPRSSRLGRSRKPQPTLLLEIDLATGKVRDWPTGATFSLHLKVCDGGEYELVGADGSVLAARHGEYVPHRAGVPGEYGDYIVCDIGPDGVIVGYRSPDPDKVVAAFWPERTA